MKDAIFPQDAHCPDSRIPEPRTLDYPDFPGPNPEPQTLNFPGANPEPQTLNYPGPPGGDPLSKSSVSSC